MRLHTLHGDRVSALRICSEGLETLRHELEITIGQRVQDRHQRLVTMQAPPAEGRSRTLPTPGC
jgi:hypothetical protein